MENELLLSDILNMKILFTNMKRKYNKFYRKAFETYLNGDERIIVA